MITYDNVSADRIGSGHLLPQSWRAWQALGWRVAAILHAL